MAIRIFAFDKMLLTKQIPASVSTAQIIFLETVYFGSAVLQYLLVTTFVGTNSCIICGLMYCGSEKKKKKKKKKILNCIPNTGSGITFQQYFVPFATR